MAKQSTPATYMGTTLSKQTIPISIANLQDLADALTPIIGGGAVDSSQLNILTPLLESLSGTAGKQNIINNEVVNTIVDLQSAITTITSQIEILQLANANANNIGIITYNNLALSTNVEVKVPLEIKYSPSDSLITNGNLNVISSPSAVDTTRNLVWDLPITLSNTTLQVAIYNQTASLYATDFVTLTLANIRLLETLTIKNTGFVLSQFDKNVRIGDVLEIRIKKTSTPNFTLNKSDIAITR